MSLLARQGRIPGAVKVDCRWIIPLSEEKPADGRASRYSKESKPRSGQADTFHFPLLLYMGADTNVPPLGLSGSELALHHAQALLEHGDVKEAYRELGSLLEQTIPTHVRSGALCTLATCCMLLRATGEAHDAARSLHELLKEDIPHRHDLLPLLNEVDALIKGRGAYVATNIYVPGYRFHPTTLTYLSSYAVSAEILRFAAAAGRYPLCLDSHDIACAKLEEDGMLYAAAHMHMELAFLHEYLHHEEASTAHFKRAVELSWQIQAYAEVSLCYSSLTPAQKSMVAECSKELFQIAKKINKVIAEGFSQLNKSHDPLFELSEKEQQMVIYAMRGLTNRQIAQELGISTVTVSKRYQALFEKTGLHSKKELTEIYARTFGLSE